MIDGLQRLVLVEQISFQGPLWLPVIDLQYRTRALWGLMLSHSPGGSGRHRGNRMTLVDVHLHGAGLISSNKTIKERSRQSLFRVGLGESPKGCLVHWWWACDSARFEFHTMSCILNYLVVCNEVVIACIYFEYALRCTVCRSAKNIVGCCQVVVMLRLLSVYRKHTKQH